MYFKQLKIEIMKISKEKFLEMATWGNQAELSILKEEFPSAFKLELENGKYYKSNFKLMGGEKSKFFVFIIDFDTQLNYGFDYSGKWCENMFFTNDHNSLTEATTAEWNYKLMVEAKKRELYNAEHFKHADTLTRNNNDRCFLPLIDSDEIWTKYGCIYAQGIWAEIIKTISKEEAEKKLGLKII